MYQFISNKYAKLNYVTTVHLTRLDFKLIVKNRVLLIYHIPVQRRSPQVEHLLLCKAGVLSVLWIKHESFVLI